MWKYRMLLVALACAMSGCVSQTATPATHGNAYVVKGSVFGTSVYNCSAKDGRAQCWRVTEKEQP